MSWHDDVSEPSEGRLSLHEHERQAMLAALRAELEALPCHVLRERYVAFLTGRKPQPHHPRRTA